MFRRRKKQADTPPLGGIPVRPETRGAWVTDERARLLQTHLGADALDHPALREVLAATPAATTHPAGGAPDAYAPSFEGPAPPGKVRGVAHVLERWGSGGVDGNVRRYQLHVRLSVSLPGREPYEVEDFVLWRGGRQTGNGLPVLVDAADPARVEILWDELPEAASTEAILDHAQRQMGAAIAQAFGGAPTAAETAMAAHQATAVQAAWQRAIDACTDDAQRREVEAMARRGGWHPPPG